MWCDLVFTAAVLLGDTYDAASIAELAEDAHVLVHEATLVNEAHSLMERRGHSTFGDCSEF